MSDIGSDEFEEDEGINLGVRQFAFALFILCCRNGKANCQMSILLRIIVNPSLFIRQAL